MADHHPPIPTLPAKAKKAAPGKALLGVVGLSLVAVGINVAATQFIAWRLDYDLALGSPLFGHTYAPWDWLLWAQAPWASAASDTFQLASAGLLGSLALCTLLGAQIAAARRRKPRKIEGLHGTARWITTVDELREIGFLPKEGESSRGVYIGAWTDPKTGTAHYLQHEGPEHIGAIAPTRSGKGVGLVLPTLLSYPNSVIVNDLKGELWGQTAGWRQKHAGNVVIKFDPASAEGSGSFNPLNEIRLKTINAIGDVQNIVTMIVDPDGKGLNDHWAKTSHALLTGLVLHLLHKEWQARDLAEIDQKAAAVEETTLYQIAFALSDPSRSVNELYEEMVQTAPYQPTPQAILNLLDDTKKQAAQKTDARRLAHDAARQAIVDKRVARNKAKEGTPAYVADFAATLSDASAVIAAAGRDMLNKPDAERGSVLSTAMSFLTLYRDPLVARNTKRSDFTIQDLMNHEKPVSLYLVVRPADKDRLRPLVRLVLNQVVRNLTRDELMRLDDGRFVSPHKRQLLLMLDEFAGSFGKMDIFEESLAFIAGYGMKAYIILQDREQLLKAYGPNENIVSNLHIRIVYAPNQTQTGQWISDMLGTTTIIKEDVTESGERSGHLGNVSRSYREIERPLLTADEVMHMRAPRKDSDSGRITHPGDMLIFAAGQYAIYGTQILYFTDESFLERSGVGVPMTQAIRGFPAATFVPSEEPAPAEPRGFTSQLTS